MGDRGNQASKAQGTIVPPPGLDLDIFGVREFWEDAKDWVLAAGGPVVRIDLSGVGDLDLSGLQVLVAMEGAVRERGFTLELAGVQPAWAQRMEGLGFTTLRACCSQERA
jgi:anti-anti-sigma regulatory factor